MAKTSIYAQFAKLNICITCYNILQTIAAIGLTFGLTIAL